MLRRVRGFLRVGHDEYWTLEMFRNVAAAVQQGVSDGPRWTKSFLLPAAAAQVVIAQGVKASAKALEEMQAKEKEDAANGTPPKKDDAAKPATPAPAPMDDGAPGGTDGEGK